MAWAEIDPPGSSTASRNSKSSTAKITAAPPPDPITTASAGTTKAHPAPLATRPPIHPFAHNDASGLPKRMWVISAAVTPAAAADNAVLIAISAACPGGTPVNRMAPAESNPDHPSSANKQPNSTRTQLWPGIALGKPSSVYLPCLGPRIQTTDKAVRPPTTWMVLEPPESTKPW